MLNNLIAPVPPGEHLQEFLEEYHLTRERLAQDIHIPLQQIDGIIQGHQTVTADLALRLSRYFGTTAQFWMNLQAGYDLEVARQKVNIESITPLAA